ncbi:hypothetical protein [Streptomyces sp. NRRL S-813]|uniref:hypothetical protein n=1 Tax=Streptomyces sp. NRRL S-813 TaxID=1463919 RepID=UPI0004BE895A|nr:hypothetical protein [Streptomyces sp. NRRL S-813]
MSTRVRSRRGLVTASALAGALCLGAVTPALAGAGTTHTTDGARRTASVPTAQGDPRAVTQRVADFYGAYIDTVWDGEDPAAGASLKALKGFYLSADARRKVAAYEAREHADGILFAQNVPVKWKVAYTGSGAGQATSRVTLVWSDRRDAQVTRIDVRSDLKTRKITDLRLVR